MPNIIGTSGIEIETYEDILNDLLNGVGDVPGFLAIYGADINVDSNSPDGQMLNIFAESKLDMLNLAVDNYDAKDPDQAVGLALDMCCQYCGIFRKGGSYTLVAVSVTFTTSVTLNGLDNTGTTPFTVSDANGNKFNLITGISHTAGTYSLNFQAEEIGNIQVLPNTLTNIVTLILGISIVNNSAGPYQQGEDQETDAQLRLRRQISTSMPARNTLEGLQAALNQICTQALVFENNTSSDPDAHGIPAHSIWVITDGGFDADIAEMIYNYKSAGVDTFGDETITITQVNGTTIDINFDHVVEEDLYLQFSVASKTSASIYNDALKAAIVSGLHLGINEAADISTISSIVSAYNSDLVIFDSGVSVSAGSYQEFVVPTLYKNKLVLSTGNIDIV